MRTHDWLETDRAGFKTNGVAWNCHDVGPYRITMDWVDGEPAMILTTENCSSSFAICLSSIGRYADPSGAPNAEGVRELYRQLPAFGRDRTQAELSYLTDIVLRYTPELIAMPPEPRAISLIGRAPEVEIEHRDANGKTLAEITV